MPRDSQVGLKVLAQTKYLRFVERDGWSFVQRVTPSRAVGIVARTPANCLVLVEQYRRPVERNVIELPAGLVGDVAGQADESLVLAAQRELLEETGYAAGEWRQLIELASCPGLTDETTTVFLATQLSKQGPGGGDASESIQVHEVPLDEAETWLTQQARVGKLIDARVYMGLLFLRGDRAGGN